MKIKLKPSLYFLTLSGSFLILIAILIAPFLKSKSCQLGNFIYLSFSPLCHQIPSRSFFLSHQPLAVCSRCLGIYGGFFLGVLFYPLILRFLTSPVPKISIFLLFLFPIGIDTLGNFFHLWSTPNLFRMLTGLFWSFILPFYFFAGLSGVSLSFLSSPWIKLKSIFLSFFNKSHLRLLKWEGKSK